MRDTKYAKHRRYARLHVIDLVTGHKYDGDLDVLDSMVSRMIKDAGQDDWLTYRGRFANTTILLQCGSEAGLITIADGRISNVLNGHS